MKVSRYRRATSFLPLHIYVLNKVVVNVLFIVFPCHVVFIWFTKTAISKVNGRQMDLLYLSQYTLTIATTDMDRITKFAYSNDLVVKVIINFYSNHLQELRNNRVGTK